MSTAEPEPERPDDRGRDTRALASGGGLNLLGSMVQAVAGLGLLAVLGRGLGAGGAGAFMEAVGVFNIAVVTTALGVGTGFIHAVSRLRVSNRWRELPVVFRAGYGPVVVAGLAGSVALWWWSDELARVFGGTTHVEDVAGYLQVFALFVVVSALASVTLGASRGFETMAPTVLLDTLVKVGGQFALVGVAVGLGLGATGIAVAWALPLPVVALGSVWWLRRLVAGRRPTDDERVEPAPRREVIRDFWSFTLPRTFSSIFAVAILWLDVLLVGALVSPRAAGIYAVATKMTTFGLAAARAVGQVTQPMIGRLVASDRQVDTKELYQTATSWQVLLTWPQYIGVAIFAPALLGLFGAEFAEGTTVVVILALAAMLGSAAGPVDMVLLMAGKSMWSFWNTALSLSVNLGLNLLLIPRLGIAGAALAWAASRLVNNVIPLVQVATVLDLHPFGPRWVRATLATTLGCGIPALLVALVGGREDLRWAVAGGVAAMAVFLPVVFLQRDALELSTILGGLGRRFRRG